MIEWLSDTASQQGLQSLPSALVRFFPCHPSHTWALGAVRGRTRRPRCAPRAPRGWTSGHLSQARLTHQTLLTLVISEFSENPPKTPHTPLWFCLLHSGEGSAGLVFFLPPTESFPPVCCHVCWPEACSSGTCCRLQGHRPSALSALPGQHPAPPTRFRALWDHGRGQTSLPKRGQEGTAFLTSQRPPAAARRGCGGQHVTLL